ncbi:DUF192 domain-containing protein [Halanaerobacter jeridensis]|uniref:Uncharacterized membrane protein (UPF0127 family) n=1 Tax=Halanaerobacter jeridensis TaxID=706427 RepID=A0A938XPY6_9FIRM|nr:DUF192 domain-containing protein [Halanaerobacter jeridensis]MBM7557187.1 uncharacterized membrane protein (UPF0127 family) [Halanaerobacter jeridensis]
MKVINASKNNIIVNEVRVANTFWQRLVGLLRHKELKENEGLIIKPCQIVHTFFMSFTIDLVFIDGHGQVLELIENLKPNRISPFVVESEQVIELASGVIQTKGIELEDEILIKN